MFRALHLFKTGATRATMDPPLSVTLTDEDVQQQPVDLAISPDNIFTTAVGHIGKRTLANWHVTSPAEIVEHVLFIVNEGDKSNCDCHKFS
jgi:trehalose 6-phosphate synthase/phosphatase